MEIFKQNDKGTQFDQETDIDIQDNLMDQFRDQSLGFQSMEIEMKKNN